jgi:hypothetical protein
MSRLRNRAGCRGAFLDHHGDPTAQLVIAVLDRQRMPLEEKIEAPTDMKQGNVVLRQFPELKERFRPDCGIVGVDARNLVGVDRRPIELVHTAPTHAHEGRLLREPMLFGKKVVPGIPRPVRVRRDERNVKTSPEEFDLGLRLVIPVASLPGPWIAGCRHLRNDHDAPALALCWSADAKSFALGHLERLELQARLIHHEVVTVEPVVPGRLLAFEGGGRVPRPCFVRTREDR